MYFLTHLSAALAAQVPTRLFAAHDGQPRHVLATCGDEVLLDQQRYVIVFRARFHYQFEARVPELGSVHFHSCRREGLRVNFWDSSLK